jgi:nucleoside phosphorylase
MPREEIDFLIVTALDVETKAVTHFLKNQRAHTHAVIGDVPRNTAVSSYVVAVAEIGEMGTDAAQTKAHAAIAHLNPRRVILTGIAAGFPESGVGYGDLLVPGYIAPYELAKVSEPNSETAATLFKRFLDWFSGGAQPQDLDYEYRGLTVSVSLPLHQVAHTLGISGLSDWATKITEPRPDGTNAKPKIFSRGASVLGSGNKLTAAKRASARKHLIETFNKNALGLEMESYGVFMACRATDTPFLVVKAMQDDATEGKDKAGEKDKWRIYAAQGAGAFTVALIQGFELRHEALVVEHMKLVKRFVQDLEKDGRTKFPYAVSKAESYKLLREKLFEVSPQDPGVLIPNEGSPIIALYGGGGSGKSHIVRDLFARSAEADYCPVLLDLKKYSNSKTDSGETLDPDALLAAVFHAGTIPPRTAREIKRLSENTRLLVFIDGLNEVSREVRAALIDFFFALQKEGKCYILGTDLLSASEALRASAHALVNRLAPEAVRSLIDKNFAPGTYDRLGDRLKEIFGRPFFLSLALRTRRTFSERSVWSAIFDEFFDKRMSFSTQQVDNLAEAAIAAFGKDGNWNPGVFQSKVGASVRESLVEAEVLDSHGVYFDHHLWRDYLAARHMSRDPGTRTDVMFDAVTTFSSSLECLLLVLEQLDQATSRDDFLKAVFDWNYIAAADCILEINRDGQSSPPISHSTHAVILAALAEKQFDEIQRTRKRAEETLRLHSYAFARPFLAVSGDDALRGLVGTLEYTDEWFVTWKRIFLAPRGRALTRDAIALVESPDSLVGWAAANSARRQTLDANGQIVIRETFSQKKGREEGRAVRWRIVHTLGAYPSDENADLLSAALVEDKYHWVWYGASRSLIAIAARSGKELRTKCLSVILGFVQDGLPKQVWMRRQILREIIEAAFIRTPNTGWKEAMVPVMGAIVEAGDHQYRDELARRFAEFVSYDEHG